MDPTSATLPAPRRHHTLTPRSPGWYGKQRVRSEHVTANAHERISLDPQEAAAIHSARQAVETALDLSDLVLSRAVIINLRRQLGIALDRLEWLVRFDAAENRNHAESYVISKRLTEGFDGEAA